MFSENKAEPSESIVDSIAKFMAHAHETVNTVSQQYKLNDRRCVQNPLHDISALTIQKLQMKRSIVAEVFMIFSIFLAFLFERTKLRLQFL